MEVNKFMTNFARLTLCRFTGDTETGLIAVSIVRHLTSEYKPENTSCVTISEKFHHNQQLFRQKRRTSRLYKYRKNIHVEQKQDTKQSNRL
jgi:hypothetical protein